MPEGKRLWRTEKGDLVSEGHSEALVLAYGSDDSLDSEDEKLVRKGSRAASSAPSDSTPAPAPAKKAAAKKAAKTPANKQAPKAINKQVDAPANKVEGDGEPEPNDDDTPAADPAAASE